ncbi:MAG: MATE family efflux transporter [Vicinamibacterales bacterium]
MSHSLRSELAPTLRLAVPVVAAELGWMGMGIVDTVMVGPLGPAAIGAVGVGAGIHGAFALSGMGLLLGLDTLVSQAFGRRDLAACHRWLFHGLALALIATVPLLALCGLTLVAIPWLGFHDEVRPLLSNYFSVVIWGTPILLLYAACRRYLQGMHIVTPVMFALVSANAVNAAGNWILIYGHLGFSPLGVAGSAWATVLARLYMLTVLVVAIWWNDRRHASGLSRVARSIDRSQLRRLFDLGLPAASQLGAEVGVFALASAMAGMVDPISSASHQVALNLAGAAFMVPLGIASAGAVRVGHAVGAGSPSLAAASGWTALALGTLVMALAGLAFLLIPGALIGLFTRDPEVLAVGTSLLTIAAVFQLFDGIQAVATGTLRGLGDTRTPMVTNLAAHWLVGLPISYTLCFITGWGVRGLWIGLSVGLIVTGAILLWVWSVKIRQYLGDVPAFAEASAGGRRP